MAITMRLACDAFECGIDGLGLSKAATNAIYQCCQPGRHRAFFFMNTRHAQSEQEGLTQFGEQCLADYERPKPFILKDEIRISPLSKQDYALAKAVANKAARIPEIHA